MSDFQRKSGPPHKRLKWNAEDFFRDPGVLKLCRAIEEKNVKAIDELVKSGVNINATGRANMTPLLWAFPMGEAVFKKMLELGANPNIQLTARIWPVCFSKGSSVMAASACSELLDGPVHDQYFYDAAMDNYLKLVLEHGGNSNIEDVNGRTPLYFINLSYPRSKLPKRLHLLLDAGADINYRNQRGDTAMMSCIDQFHFVHELLTHGADYRFTDSKGFDTVLLLERERRFLEERRQGTSDDWTRTMIDSAKPVLDWLTNEGVNWDAARTALKDKDLVKNLKNLPTDYKHRPWLPQRPTLKKPDGKSPKP